jgi:hypothetical protein
LRQNQTKLGRLCTRIRRNETHEWLERGLRTRMHRLLRRMVPRVRDWGDQGVGGAGGDLSCVLGGLELVGGFDSGRAPSCDLSGVYALARLQVASKTAYDSP